MTEWRVAQRVSMKRRRLAISALHDHAVAVADARVARAAIDVEALLTTRQNFSRERERQPVAVLAWRFIAGEVVSVFVQLPASDGTGQQRTPFPGIGKEITAPQRLHARLVVHVVPAGAEENQIQN